MLASGSTRTICRAPQKQHQGLGRMHSNVQRRLTQQVPHRLQHHDRVGNGNTSLSLSTQIISRRGHWIRLQSALKVATRADMVAHVGRAVHMSFLLRRPAAFHALTCCWTCFQDSIRTRQLVCAKPARMHRRRDHGLFRITGLCSGAKPRVAGLRWQGHLAWCLRSERGCRASQGS